MGLEIKDIAFYGMSVPAFLWGGYELYNVFGLTQQLKSDYPECYKTNPN